MAAGGDDAAAAADIAGRMGNLRIDETPTPGSRISVRLECPYVQKVFPYDGEERGAQAGEERATARRRAASG